MEDAKKSVLALIARAEKEAEPSEAKRLAEAAEHAASAYSTLLYADIHSERNSPTSGATESAGTMIVLAD